MLKKMELASRNQSLERARATPPSHLQTKMAEERYYTVQMTLPAPINITLNVQNDLNQAAELMAILSNGEPNYTTVTEIAEENTHAHTTGRCYRAVLSCDPHEAQDQPWGQPARGVLLSASNPAETPGPSAAIPEDQEEVTTSSSTTSTTNNSSNGPSLHPVPNAQNIGESSQAEVRPAQPPQGSSTPPTAKAPKKARRSAKRPTEEPSRPVTIAREAIAIAREAIINREEATEAATAVIAGAEAAAQAARELAAAALIAPSRRSKSGRSSPISTLTGRLSSSGTSRR